MYAVCFVLSDVRSFVRSFVRCCCSLLHLNWQQYRFICSVKWTHQCRDPSSPTPPSTPFHVSHTHTLPPHFLSFCAAAVGWFDYIDCQCRLGRGIKREKGRGRGGAPGVNVLGFNLSSTSARRYSLNCIVHSQLLPIYSANAFCTNKLNQFNCPRGEGAEGVGR